MNTEDINKKLKLNAGICKRLLKEVASYEKEVQTQENKVQKMRDEERDPYDIRKQEEVLQESYMMVPDSKARLEAAVIELRSILESEDISEAGELIDANLLAECRSISDTVGN